MSSAFVFRLLAWSFALLLLALPVVGLLNGSFASERWPLRHLDLQAELQQVSLEQIQGVVAQHTQQGFFALSLTGLRSALAELPWVESVEVRKRWPDTVSVRLLEYQPYAIWDGRALVSRSGHLFQVPAIDALGGLPRLSGPDAQVADVVNFHARAVRLMQGTPLTVSESRLSPRGSWTVVLDGGAEVVLGRELASERLERFAATVTSLLNANPGVPLRHADLRYPNGYALTWARAADDVVPGAGDPATEPPPESQPVPVAMSGGEAHRSGSSDRLDATRPRLTMPVDNATGQAARTRTQLQPARTARLAGDTPKDMDA